MRHLKRETLTIRHLTRYMNNIHWDQTLKWDNKKGHEHETLTRYTKQRH